MKRYLPGMVFLLALLWVGLNWFLSGSSVNEYDFKTLSRIPVLANGRLQPLDTVARNSLLIIHGRQTVRLEGGQKPLEADHWLADVLFNSPVADQYPVFVINNPEVLGLFGWQQSDRKFFSFAELIPFLKKINEQGSRADGIDSSQRTRFDTAIFNLRNALILYQRLKNSLRPEEIPEFAPEISDYLQLVPEGRAAMDLRDQKQKYDQKKFDLYLQLSAAYQTLGESAYLRPIPPLSLTNGRSAEWQSVGESVLRAASGEISPVIQAYALIGDAYHAGDASLYNRRVGDLSVWMVGHQQAASGRGDYEFLFNHLDPFYQSMSLYVLAFLLICLSWLGDYRWLNLSAFYVLLLALAIHTFGLLSRMYLSGRPPVTNLYSSAIFIGWGTVILGLVLEKIYRDGIGSACAAAIGFVTLIIAHHLAGTGDTLEMLQAVLDTNIWLATHVVVITLGYASMFLAGTLAILYVMRGLFTSSLTPPVAQSLVRMTYGILCFATLFSFVGTVLGGIWADQSWGRFWGWDPKENGALMIVLWCALILHARWGGLIKDRGLMVMTLFGNVITSFSWFGVNMLGVGLHSYGFMEKAFPWLIGFIISQLLLMLLAQVPLSRWKSFSTGT